MDLEGRHESLWIGTAPGPDRPPLDTDLEADVVVIGSGMVGILSALLLQRAGREVVVLEAGGFAEGVTGHTTAKVTSQHGLSYASMAERFGEEKARLHGEANEQGKEAIASLVRELEIDCGFTRAPAYVVATDSKDAARVEQEAEVTARLGLPSSLVTETELPFSVHNALRFDNQAHFHPRRFLQGVADAFEKAGGRIHQHTRVTEIDDGTPCRLVAAGRSVQAEEVIVATNVPINDRAFFTPRMEPNRQYGLAFSVDAPPVEGMYIEAGSPVRSLRPYEGEDGPMLVFVGEKHHVGGGGDTAQHYTKLAAYARSHFTLGPLRYRWSTQDYYPVDGVPYIGRYGPTTRHVHTATGFRAWGMSQAAVAAMLFSQELTGHDSPWSDVYDPFAPGRLVKDLVDPKFMKMQGKIAKKFIAERLVHQAGHKLAPGDGEIAEVDGEKLALHRDTDGVLHACQAQCTHMGCYVAWNRAEQSWDCPCHGSRFSGAGQVLHGPASKPLERMEPPPGPEA